MDRTKVELGFRLVLEGLGVDLSDPHLAQTPHRVMRAWTKELCVGLDSAPPKVTTFPTTHDEMVILRDIPIRSLCSHHLLPFFGSATIGYVPANSQILGLSKLSRVANYYARRPSVQEELTTQIAEAVAGYVGMTEEQGGVGVIVRATHTCMLLRGVNHSGEMVTSALRGRMFTDPVVRSEFLSLAR